MATPNVPPAVPPKKGMGALGWILIGCGGLVVLCILGAMAGGYFIYHKAKQAGLDTELLKNNPAAAAVKMAIAANPDLELMRMDQGAGKVTIREKSTGKVVTLNFDDVKNGRFSMEGDQGKVTFEAQGENGGHMKVTSPEGTAEWGANVKAPAWFPVYPGAKAEGSYTQNSGSETAGGFSFETSDPPDKVMAYYSSALEKAGMKVGLTTQSSAAAGQQGASTLSAETPDGSRRAGVVVMTDGGATKAIVTYQSK